MHLYNSSNIFIEISGIIMTLISFYVISFYFSQMLLPKKENKFYVFKYFLMLTINYFISRTTPILYENRDIVIHSTILIMPFLFSKDKSFKKILISFSWISFNLLINSINNILLMSKFNLSFNDLNTKPYEELKNIMQDGYAIFCIQAFSYTLLSFIEICILLLKNNKSIKTLQIFLINLFATILVIVSTLPPYFFIDINNPILVIIGLVSFSISILLMIYSYNKIKFYQFHYKALAENKFLKQKEELQLEYYKIMSKKEENIKKINHDIKNNLQVIYSLKNNIEKEKLINSIVTDLNKSELINYSSNDILNIIINTKVDEAKNKNINIEIELRDKLDFIEDLDISNLFSNILDNAIENSSKSSNKKISLKVNKKINYIILKCNNTYDGIIKKDNKNSIKTRKDNLYHGYGLKIINEIVTKYNGEIDFSYTDKEFNLNIIFPEKLK